MSVMGIFRQLAAISNFAVAMSYSFNEVFPIFDR
jgi:hypothetical protein